MSIFTESSVAVSPTGSTLLRTITGSDSRHVEVMALTDPNLNVISPNQVGVTGSIKITDTVGGTLTSAGLALATYVPENEQLGTLNSVGATSVINTVYEGSTTFPIFTITGNWTGSIQLQHSQDSGLTWSGPIPCRLLSGSSKITEPINSVISNITGSSIYAGLIQQSAGAVRLCMTAWTSGTASTDLEWGKGYAGQLFETPPGGPVPATLVGTQLYSGSVGPVRVYQSAANPNSSDAALGVRLNMPANTPAGQVTIASSQSITANQGTAGSFIAGTGWPIIVNNSSASPLVMTGSVTVRGVDSLNQVPTDILAQNSSIGFLSDTAHDYLSTQPVGSTFNPFTQDTSNNMVISRTGLFTGSQPVTFSRLDSGSFAVTGSTMTNSQPVNITGSTLPFTSQTSYTGSSVIVTAANSNTSLLGAQTGLRNYITSIGVSWLGSGSTGGGIIATIWNSGSVLWQTSLTGSALFNQQTFPSPIPSIWSNSIISGSIGATANIRFNLAGFVAP